ncbi:MAG: T9SS type A sorting domain-containing protein [Bacteroidota bacterium]
MRHKRLKLSAVILLVLGLTGLHAQESVNASGGDASGSGGSIGYSVGQVVYTANSGTTGSAAEGVQQPYEISVLTGLEEAKGISLSLMAYPNPTTDNITLVFDNSVKTSYDLSQLSYQLYDMNGKLLQNEKITGNQTSVDMSNLIPATYFVKVIHENRGVHHVKYNEVVATQFNVVKTFKIIKTL